MSLFSFSRSARSWRSGPRLPRRLWGVSGGLIENIFTIIGGSDGDYNARKEVGGCCVVRRVCVSFCLLEASCHLRCFIDSKLFWWSWFALVRNLTCWINIVDCWICRNISWSKSTASKYFWAFKYLRTIIFQNFFLNLNILLYIIINTITTQ